MQILKSIFIITLLPQTFAFNALAAINPDKADIKHYWNLSAVGDTIDQIYKPYCPVTLSELLRISDYLKNNPASINDIRKLCVDNHRIQEGNREKSDEPCIPKPGATTQVGICDLFIEKLIDNQNQIAKNFISDGTYITHTSKNNVYKIQNVVLGSDSTSYGKPGNIYLIDKDWKKAALLSKYKTYTLDMFVNITNTNKTRGVFNKSYIYLDTDLSDWLYGEYNSWDRGIPVIYALSTMVAGLPKNRYDIKRQFLDKYKEPDQTEVDAHTNGFLFQNKVVNLEWLGHFLIGMTQNETGVSKKLSTAVINWLQKSDNNGAEEQGDTEADHFIRANQFGREYQQIISHFSGTKTKTKQDAVKLVLQYAKSLNKWSEIHCFPSKSKCNPKGQDYLICEFDGVTYNMEFDSICAF